MPELNIIGAKEQNRYFPYQAGFRVTRETFFQAGQDSYTNPPAQNPDLFQALTNVEPVTQGNLQRRRGYTLFAGTAPTVPFHEAYAYRNEITSTRRLVWTSPSTVVTTDESGNIISSPLFTPALTASTVRMVLSRSFGYFADGVQADYQKWDGTTLTTNLTNWGIAILNSPSSTYGPVVPGTVTSVSNGLGGPTWVSTNSTTYPFPPSGTLTSAVAAVDAVYDAVSVSGSAPSQDLYCQNFTFSGLANAAQITGILVSFVGAQNFTPPGQIEVQLLKAGVPIGPRRIIVLPNFPVASFSVGGPSDSWGVLLTGADANTSTFGFLVTADTGAENFFIDLAQITLFVSGSTVVLGSPTGTGITLLSGRVYSVVFQNSNAGTTSALYPFSSSTGPLTNESQPLSGLPVSSDPQVDSKLLLATADGGDETTLYLVAQIPNATTTYTDTMPDSQLLLQSIYQQTDVNGNLHGVANNNPPPLIDFPIKHKGRIFGVIGPALYYSKNLDDVTTSTGTITGKWEEAWPATYQQDISERAESVTGLLSDGQTLYIGSDVCIRRFIGDSPSNFQEPEVIYSNTGVINQETWQIVFTEGQPVGSMWLTPDYRVMFSDFNSYVDVGTPIQDILNSVTNSVAQTVSHACFVSRGSSEYFMLYLPINGSTTVNILCVYNLRTKKWYIWYPTDSPSTSLYNINVTGVPQWLFATNAGPLYYWDNTVRQDRNGGTPVSYAASMTTSWLDFGDMGLTKALNKIIATTADRALTVGVQGAIRDSDLDSGGQVVIPATVVQQEIFGDLFVPMVAQPGLYKWYQLTFTSPTSTVIDILDAFDFDVMPSMRM